MAQDSDATTEYKAEVTKAEYRETDDWEFVANVRVNLHNPEGADVAVTRTYKARPRYDDLVHNEDHVHEFAAYWWPDAYPANGDSPFTDASHDWEPVADLSDDDALLEECIENATFDPHAELNSLKSRGEHVRRKLEDG